MEITYAFLVVMVAVSVIVGSGLNWVWRSTGERACESARMLCFMNLVLFGAAAMSIWIMGRELVVVGGFDSGNTTLGNAATAVTCMGFSAAVGLMWGICALVAQGSKRGALVRWFTLVSTIGVASANPVGRVVGVDNPYRVR